MTKIISIIGYAGVGKSSIINKLKNELFLYDIEYVTFGIGQNKIAHKAVIYNKVKNKKPTLLIKILYNLFYPVKAFDMFLQYRKKITKSSADIIITDRYCSDLYATPHIPLFIRKCFLKLCPIPDLTIYLYDSPEEILKRSDIKDINKIYKGLKDYEHIINYLGAIKTKPDIGLVEKEIIQYLRGVKWNKKG